MLYATTNEDGYCTINEIESQIEYIVSVSKVNYTSDSEILFFELGDSLSVSFDVTWINGEISGFVRDQNGNPVNSVEVTAASEDGYYSQTLSTFNGSYLLENLAGDRNYSINASKQGFSQIDETIVLVEPKNETAADVFLSFKDGCAYNEFGLNYLKENFDKEYKNLQFGNYEIILGCVKAGMGISILPLSIVKKLKYEKIRENRF